MKKILVLGAGRSAGVLIARLAANKHFQITVSDIDAQALSKISGLFPQIEVYQSQEPWPQHLFEQTHLVVSLLPPAMHIEVAKRCLEVGAHLCTASYVSAEMAELHEAAFSKRLIFLNECGLDPGIDHMSSMKLIDKLHQEGAEIYGYESYCGGLISEKSAGDNPWKYKFTWNPGNVVLAAQAGAATFLEKGKERVLPVNRIFADFENIESKQAGRFQAYMNRDSLSYLPLYGLPRVLTFKRGTLRRGRFCEAWNTLYQSGLCQPLKVNAWAFQNSSDWLFAITGFDKEMHKSVSSYFIEKGILNQELKSFVDYLELEQAEIAKNATNSAQILQNILEEKWAFAAGDEDEVVMIHKLQYRIGQKEQILTSTMVINGNLLNDTAMSKTVGLPLAFAVEEILEKKISEFGVVRPLSSAWYEPILHRLEKEGISFKEEISSRE